MQKTFLSSRLVAVIWLILLMIYILAGTADVPFHGDESTQIYMSHDYAYQFIEHDYDKIAYSPNPVSATEQELRLLNGTVNKYLIGLTGQVDGLSVKDINEQWDWGADWNYNQQNGHAPSSRLLFDARWPSAILLAAGVIVIFAIGRVLGGAWTPYVASFYYALNPALLVDGRRAMMEGSFTFFSLLVVLVGIWLLQKPSLTRGVLLGLVSGFAVASKHTAAFTVGTVFVAVLLYLIYQSVRSEDDYSVVDYVLLPYLAIAGIIAFGTFLALNPAWWGDPIARGQTVLKLRQDLLNGQVLTFGGYTSFGDQVGGFLRQSLIVTPQYYEVGTWQNYIGDQISRYEASVWHGVSVGGSILGAVILCGIMAAGAWDLIRPKRIPDANEATEKKSEIVQPQGGIRWLIGLWVLVTSVTTLILTPLEWQRYYLPMYPVIGILTGLGVNKVIQSRNQWLTFPHRIKQEAEIPLSGDEPRPDTLPELP